MFAIFEKMKLAISSLDYSLLIKYTAAKKFCQEMLAKTPSLPLIVPLFALAFL